MLATFLFVTPTASAHSLEREGYVYWTDNAECTWAEAHQTDSDSYTGLYSYAAVALDYAFQSPFGSYSCEIAHEALPGYMAVKRKVYKWNSTGGYWGLCRSTNWVYNTKQVHKLYIHISYKPAPCGKGYYYTRSLSYIYNDGWHGGAVWTDYDWVIG